MSEPPKSGAGLSQSVRRILDSALALVENRLELLIIEFHEERIRLLRAAIFVLALFVCGGLALMLATLAILLLFWDNGRWIALAALLAGYSAGGFYCWHRLNQLLQSSAAFSATLEQFRKDLECLRRQN
jgi:uncharacterized membrane protein YqjE